MLLHNLAMFQKGVIGIQARLICNLLDGMVAQESGVKSSLGKIMNEVPDRYSDIILLLGAEALKTMVLLSRDTEE